MWADVRRVKSTTRSWYISLSQIQSHKYIWQLVRGHQRRLTFISCNLYLLYPKCFSYSFLPYFWEEGCTTTEASSWWLASPRGCVTQCVFLPAMQQEGSSLWWTQRGSRRNECQTSVCVFMCMCVYLQDRQESLLYSDRAAVSCIINLRVHICMIIDLINFWILHRLHELDTYKNTEII